VFQLILYQPEIPPNTGNMMRLCANVGASLHLVHPLGFEMDAKKLRRAGLDYRDLARVYEHADLEACLAAVEPRRLWAMTTKATQSLFDAAFELGDAFLLGPETRGLPDCVLASIPEERRLRIPLKPGNRSLNVSNAAAIALYEAWRQVGIDEL
jgi:tRNA (cytidine/uridine-2'-O-)-methyltransferase